MSTSNWPPHDLQMPDLSGLEKKLILNLVIRRIIGKYNLQDPKTYALVMSYIRLVDQIVVYYLQTRLALIDFVEHSPSGLMSSLLLATGYAESLITTITRAIRLGRRIRRDEKGPEIAKKIPMLSDAVWTRINDMRAAIEHVDEKFVQNVWEPEMPYLLLLKTDSLELMGSEITYLELARWITELHEIGSLLSKLEYESP